MNFSIKSVFLTQVSNSTSQDIRLPNFNETNYKESTSRILCARFINMNCRDIDSIR